jgi:hypothetical protein
MNARILSDRSPFPPTRFAWNASLQQMSIAARYREEYPPGGVDFVDELSDDPRGILMKNFAHLSYGLFFRRIAARQIVIDSLVDMVRLWGQNKKH